MSYALLSSCRRSFSVATVPQSSPHHRHHHYFRPLRHINNSPRSFSLSSSGSSPYLSYSSAFTTNTTPSWAFPWSPHRPLTKKKILRSSASSYTLTTASSTRNFTVLAYPPRRPSALSSTASANRLVSRPNQFQAMNGADDASAKRKRSSAAAAPTSVDAETRPAKHLKPELSTSTDGALPSELVCDYETEEDASRLHAIGSTSADSPEWQATIENVVKSVVSIHFCQTCSFDTELSMSSQATGFVVDAERGYILTNRHVVCSGPFWGYVIFDNHEEVNSLLRLLVV